MEPAPLQAEGRPMTAMLARVGTVHDATAAMAGGVDRLVVRRLEPEMLSAIGGAARGRCPVSLWWDDDASGSSAALMTAVAASGADEIWSTAEVAIDGVRRRAVLAPGDMATFMTVAARRCEGVVIDGGEGPLRLLATQTIASLERQCRSAAALGLAFGISGPMEAPDVPRLLALSPDILVMDDLLRRDGSASNPIDPGRVRSMRSLMDSEAGSNASAAPPAIVPTEPDRIFVRDWTLALHLGAYGHERASQRVRFTVEAEVDRTTARAADMRDVVTYDLITDAIARATVAHVALVETIAEDVAAMILAHPRVSAVDVTVEKLDLGPGALGCRIKRRRVP